jgi:molybdopterin-binding protein
MTMLEVRNLTKQLGIFKLGPIDLNIEQGCHYVLLGPSGSGKSLVLELISGFQLADAGTIKLNGSNIDGKAIQNRTAAFIFQHAALFPHMTVAANIAYPLKGKRLSRREVNSRVQMLASRFSIDHLLQRRPASLSGGEIQRVSIARALAAEPKILLLDEPLSALDVQLRANLREVLRQLKNEGMTMLHVTHDYEEAVRLADQVGIMQDGKLVQAGSVRHVFSSPSTGFVAHLTGQRNYFEALLDDQTPEHLRTARVNGLEVKLYSPVKAGKGMIIINEDQITLLIDPSTSSAQNQIKGTIQTISKLTVGSEVVVDAGIILHVKITDESVEKLELSVGKDIFLSFKASAVRFLSI